MTNWFIIYLYWTQTAFPSPGQLTEGEQPTPEHLESSVNLPDSQGPWALKEGRCSHLPRPGL